MTNIVLVRELFTTSMLLQDLYANLRRKESEIELMKAAHEEELKAQASKMDTLKSQSMLMQMLLQTSLPVEEETPGDEYKV